MSKTAFERGTINPEQAPSTIKQTQDQMLMNEANHHYLQAHVCKQKLLRQHQDLRKEQQKQMQQRHETEMIYLHQEYDSRQTHLRREWQNKTHEQQATRKAGLAQLKAQFQSAKKQLVLKLEESIPKNGVDSVELANLKKIEGSLARQHKFVEAENMKNVIKQQSQREHYQWEKARHEKIELAVANLKEVHKKQKELFKSKTQEANDIREYSYAAEKQLIEQQRHNHEKILKGTHRRELISLIGGFTTRGGSDRWAS